MKQEKIYLLIEEKKYKYERFKMIKELICIIILLVIIFLQRIGVCKMKRIYKINENEYIEEIIQECKTCIIIIIKGIAYIVILGTLFNFVSKLF